MYILLVAFATGLLASLTPCIYPMIPITISILQVQASKSFMQNFVRALFYVLGIAVTYATLGYVAAKTTVMFGQWMANPWLIGIIVLFFLYLAFSMFGFYEIYVPKFMTRQLEVSPRGSLFYSFLFGAVSGLIASPCLTPALAGLLGYVAKQGNPVLGFITMFMFALGMGTILLVIGTFSGAVVLLPRAGMWMVEIKKFFGFLLLGVTVYFLQPLLDQTVITVLYVVVGLGAILYYIWYFVRRT